MARKAGFGLGLALVLLWVAALAACRQGAVPSEDRVTGPGGVTLGMSRAQVQRIMLDEIQKLQMVGQVRNPYSSEIRRAPDGTLYEVWFYYMGLRRADNRISDDELVPIILRDGVVTGWGWEELRRLSIVHGNR